MKEDEIIRQKVLLVGVDAGEEEDFERSMEELKSLAEACEMQVVGILTQRMDTVNKALYIGTGNVVQNVIKDIDIRALSTEVAGGFVGCTLGLYASDSEEREVPVKALFKSFGYRRITSDKRQ